MKNAVKAPPAGEMRGQPRGFTLVELTLTIVILGILAAVALPRMVNLGDSAEEATINSFVGSLATARALFIAKTALCNATYPSAADAGFLTFVSYDSGGWLTGCSSPYNTIATKPTVDVLAANPGDTFVQSASLIRINTKGGHRVDISLNATTGEISWSATPPY